MKRNILILITLSALPWLYVGADLLFDFTSLMHGFGYLPFFGLLLAKEKVIRSPEKQAGWSSVVPNPYLRNTLLVIAAVFLTVIVVILSEWVRESLGQWLWVPFVLLIPAFVFWDIKRAYRD